MKSKIIELTDSKNQVMIDIVYTISQSERWYTLKEVADAINLSDRSSQRYVNHLYETVMAYNDEKEEHFSLLMKKNYGIKLLISSQANVEFLVNYILQEDENVKLLIALLFQDYESMTNYIELNCLAKYHVDQACSKCNDLLSVFSLEIEKKEFRINGKESNIRIFMHNFCWTLYKCEVWPDKFNFIDYHVIESDIIHITESLNIPITNPIKLKNITYRLTISLIRYYKKKPVVLSNKLKEAVPTYVNESDSLVLTEIVEQVFNKHLIDNQDEIYFFILYLLTGSTIYDSLYMKKNILDYHRKIKSDVFEATELFFEIFQKKISSITTRDLNSSYEFVFRSHLKAAIYRELEIGFERCYFSDETMSNYVIDSTKMKEFIKFMKKQNDLTLFEENIYLSQRYMILVLSLDLQMAYNEPIKIKLNTDYPNIYEEFIKSYISDYFKYEYKLVFIDNNFFQEPDFVLSSLPELDAKEQEVIDISYPIRTRELKKIQTKLEEVDN
jgi:hypothetical protein